MTDIMTLHEPPNWQLYRLGQLFDERKEKVSDKDYPPLSVTMNGIVPQLETAAKSDDSDNRKLVKVGDYVINSRSDRKGSGGISSHDGSVSLISIVMKPKGVHPRFAHHLLRSRAFQEEFYRWGHGIVADLWTTRFADMKNIRLYLPDLDTQKAIADFLDRETACIDQLIEKKQRLVVLLGEQRSAAISSAVTVGLDDTAELVSTGSQYLPQVPATWRVWRLKHLAEIRGGLTLGRQIPDDVEATLSPYMRVANVQAGWLDLSDVAEIPVTEVEKKRYCLRYGDVLMNEGGDNDKLGRGAVWKCEIASCVHQNHVFAVRPHDAQYSDWISLATNARYARDFFYLHSNQSTNLASISKTNLSRFPIALPPIDEMKATLRALWDRVRKLDGIGEKTKTSIDRLKEYRAALITAAVTGQIDLATWGKHGQTDRRLDEIEEAMQA